MHSESGSPAALLWLKSCSKESAQTSSENQRRTSKRKRRRKRRRRRARSPSPCKHQEDPISGPRFPSGSPPLQKMAAGGPSSKTRAVSWKAILARLREPQRGGASVQKRAKACKACRTLVRLILLSSASSARLGANRSRAQVLASQDHCDSMEEEALL